MKIKPFKLILLIISILFLSCNLVFASLDAIIVKDNKSHKLYEYNYSELKDSYFDNLTGGESKLFKEYEGNIDNIVAYLNSDNKYISYKLIIDEFFDKITSNENFDLDEFMGKCSENDKMNIAFPIEVRTISNGRIITKEVKLPVVFDVKSIY